MIELGATVTDRITNFRGIATGRASYLTGCDQYLVATSNPDRDPKWFDEQRLVIDHDVKILVLDNSKGNGADIPAPIK